MSQDEKNRRSIEVDHLMAEVGKRTASGGAIAVAAQIVKALVQLGSLMVLARLLPPQDFGIVAMAATVTLFIGLFTDLGLSAATVQRKDIDQNIVSALFYINAGSGWLVLLIAAAAAPLAAWGFGDPRVLPVVMALGIQAPLAAAGAQHRALLQRGMRWVALQTTDIGAQAMGAGIAILIAATTDLGYWALVAQSLIAAATGTALAWTLCPWRPGRVRNWSDTGSALKFGLNLTGFNLVNYFHRQLDDVLIGWRWGASELGFYTRAYQLLTLPLVLINTPMASAVIPALSRLQGDPERWRKAYLEALSAACLAASGIAAVLVATARPLVIVLYGPDWARAADIFQWLAISMFAAIPMNAMGWIYISLGRSGRMFIWSLLSTPLIVISFLIGLPFGGTGVALSYSCMVCALAIPCFAFGAHGSPVRVLQIIRVVAFPTIVGAASAAAGLMEQKLGTSSLEEVCIASAISIATYAVGATALLISDPRYSLWRGRAAALFGRA